VTGGLAEPVPAMVPAGAATRWGIWGPRRCARSCVCALAPIHPGGVVSSFFRAIAIDYDGTLAGDEGPSGEVRAALRDARAEGRRLVLVTGRILEELARVLPDAEELFDAIVAENGAVLHVGRISRALTSPVPVELDAALLELGIPFRRGQVLLACQRAHEREIFEALAAIDSDCQLVRNRGELMVLPAGVSKGLGLFDALGELGVSYHSTLGVGDAENDRTLLEQCELGVAVGNAVDSLKEHADVVLGPADGDAVAGLLRGPLLRGELRVEPKRWQIEIGRTAGGEVVRLPGSQVSLLVTGGSGAGKSYAAGLVAERLIELGYSVCVFDPEGDHAPLGRLRGVSTVGGRGRLPEPEELAGLLQHRLGSLVVDLSLLPTGEREAYLERAIEALQRQRSRTGIPHWIFIDEAHVPLRSEGVVCEAYASNERGFCLVTFRPADLCETARESFEFVLLVAGDKGVEPDSAAFLEARIGSERWEDVLPLLGSLELGQALLARLGREPELHLLSLGPRWVRHVRHWHKYGYAHLPAPRRFYVRGPRGPTGAVAGNLAELHRELVLCGPEVIEHHVRGGDFSRWIGDVIQDEQLADETRAIETRALAGAPIEDVRRALVAAIEARYLE
jgi:hydroxymethylpyrimidine pyrophosphatase-like HAD family hydrolase